jgi:hypothetical protein
VQYSALQQGRGSGWTACGNRTRATVPLRRLRWAGRRVRPSVALLGGGGAVGHLALLGVGAQLWVVLVMGGGLGR